MQLLEELISLDNTDLLSPKERVAVIDGDPAHNLVLECAAASFPDYIVSTTTSCALGSPARSQ